MSKLKLIVVVFFFLPNLIFCQDFSNVKTRSGQVKIPGKWEQLNTVDDSGQTYLKNKDGIVIAIAQNPKKAYSFFKSNLSAFENVKLFYTWDSDWRRESKFKTDKIKEDTTLECVIWKYNDGKLDNIFLFGSSKDNFLNLMVYSDTWSEADQIVFLENLYKLNR
jgi:hypothetical protein